MGMKNGNFGGFLIEGEGRCSGEKRDGTM